jgi:hypothetical protein
MNRTYYADNQEQLNSRDFAQQATRTSRGSYSRPRIGVEDWNRYVSTATRQYRPQLLTRAGYVDLNALTIKVKEDMHLAKQ